MSEEPETEVELINALDDAHIRQHCFSMASGVMQGCEFEEILENAQTLYDWVMGSHDATIEDAAEPASVTPEESCEPQRH